MAVEAKITQEYETKLTITGSELVEKSLKAIEDRNWHLETQLKRLQKAKATGNQKEIQAAEKSVATDKKKLAQLERELALRQRIYGLQQRRGVQLSAEDKALQARERQLARDQLARDKLTGREGTRIWQGMTPEDRVNYQITRFKQVFRRVADALISFYVINAMRTVFGGFFRNMIQANSQLELMRQRLQTLGRGGGSFENIKKAIVELTVTTPFMVQDFADAAIQLEAFGLNAEKYLKPVADWAAVTGKGVQDAALAFSKIATGSPRTALLLSTRAISKEDFDRELRQSANRAEALNAIISRNFGDMAQRMSQTFQGFMSNINDIFFFISEKLGKGIFLAMRKDLEWIYRVTKDLAGGFAEANPVMLKFSQILNGIYLTLKNFVPFFAIAGAIWSSKRLTDFGKGLMAWVGTLNKTVHWTIKTLSWAALASGALSLIVDQIALFKDYERAADKATEASKRFYMGSVQYITAYQEKLLTLQAIQNNWTMMFIEGLAIMEARISGGLVDGPATQYLKKLNKEIKEAVANLETAQRLAQKETQLKLAKEPASPYDLFEIRQLMESKANGREYLQAFSKRIELRKKEIEQELKIPILSESYRDELEIENARATNLKRTIDLVLKYNLGQLRTKANQEAINNVVGASIPLTDEFKDSLGQLLDKEKGGSEVAKDYLERIRAVKDEIRSLHQGESNKWAEIVKYTSLVLQYRVRLATDKTLSEEDRLKLELKYQEAIRDRLKSRKEFESQIADKSNDALKARKGLLEAEADYSIRVLQHEYEKTKDLVALEHARGKTLAEIKNQIREAEAAKSSAEQRALRAPYDPMVQVESQIEIYRWEKEIVDLRAKELALVEDIVFATSTEWVNAFWKVKLELLETINTFKDSFAKFVTSNFIQTTSGIVSALLWGEDGEDKTSQKVAELNEQLLTLRMERDREFAQTEKARRAAGETNEEYASRMQMWEQQTALQKMSWEYQDKELQLLSEINAQEEQRNNLILDRLKSLGQKVMDELIGQVITMGVSQLFKNVQPTVSDVIKGYGGDVFNQGPHDRGGSTQIFIEGNTFLNERDFETQVDRAIAKISDRRGENARYTR